MSSVFLVQKSFPYSDGPEDVAGISLSLRGAKLVASEMAAPFELTVEGWKKYKKGGALVAEFRSKDGKPAEEMEGWDRVYFSILEIPLRD